MNYYKQNKLVSEKVGKDTLIIDHEKGFLITLNQTAAFVWDLLRRPKTELEITESYARKYGKDKVIDSTNTLKDMMKAGVIVRRGS